MIKARDHHHHHNRLRFNTLTIVRCTTAIFHMNKSHIISAILTTPNRHRFDHLIQATAYMIFMSLHPTKFLATYPRQHFLRRHPDFDLLNQYT